MNKEDINNRISQLELELQVLDSSYDSRSLEQFLAKESLKQELINNCIQDIKELNV